MNTNPDTSQPFSTQFDLVAYYRPLSPDAGDWFDLDRGPGIIPCPPDSEVRLRIKGIDDDDLARLVDEIDGHRWITALDLAENRKITDAGLKHLGRLSWLTFLNLSSCSLTSIGMPYLSSLTSLRHLDLSYCNRLTDIGLKSLKKLSNLTYLNMQGCVKISNGGLARLRMRKLSVRF